MLEELKQEVCAANLKLVEYGLVILTWGNVSAITPDRKYVVIKPSGVPYDTMTAEQMVVTDLEGHVVEGNLRPSSDLLTHLELYRSFPQVNAVVHTHSRYAVVFAQAERDLPCYGTTHADTFYGPVPCTRHLTAEEVARDYEGCTGKVIAETFAQRDPMAVPGGAGAEAWPLYMGGDQPEGGRKCADFGGDRPDGTADGAACPGDRGTGAAISAG